MLMLCLSILYAYFYVVVRPDVGIHQAVGAEPALAGDWRGQFAHKNISGAVYTIAILAGLQSRQLKFFYAILLVFIPLEIFFILHSGDKTALYLGVPVFGLIWLVRRLKTSLSIVLAVVLPLALLNLLMVGSLYSDSLQFVVSKVIGDASFTGRTELWKLLIYYSSLFPFVGSGFQSFWGLDSDSPAAIYQGSWASEAIYGHQSYLDLMASVGIPGLCIALVFLFVRPAIDLSKIKDRGSPIVGFYMSLWLFPPFQAVTEFELVRPCGSDLGCDADRHSGAAKPANRM